MVTQQNVTCGGAVCKNIDTTQSNDRLSFLANDLRVGPSWKRGTCRPYSFLATTDCMEFMMAAVVVSKFMKISC